MTPGWVALVAAGQPAAATGNTLKVWNGSAWVPGVLKVWNGSAWVAGTMKVYDGGAFG